MAKQKEEHRHFNCLLLSGEKNHPQKSKASTKWQEEQLEQSLILVRCNSSSSTSSSSGSSSGSVAAAAAEVIVAAVALLLCCLCCGAVGAVAAAEDRCTAVKQPIPFESVKSVQCPYLLPAVRAEMRPDGTHTSALGDFFGAATNHNCSKQLHLPVQIQHMQQSIVPKTYR